MSCIDQSCTLSIIVISFILRLAHSSFTVLSCTLHCCSYLCPWFYSRRAGVAETERVYECDMVLLAMGFVGPEKSILDELSLAQDSRGNIDTCSVKYLTTVPRVYTAGGT